MSKARVSKGRASEGRESEGRANKGRENTDRLSSYDSPFHFIIIQTFYFVLRAIAPFVGI